MLCCRHDSEIFSFENNNWSFEAEVCVADITLIQQAVSLYNNSYRAFCPIKKKKACGTTLGYHKIKEALYKFITVDTYNKTQTFFFFFLLSDHHLLVDYFVTMVRAGYLCVAIIHQTLTRTTGSLTCAQMLMHVSAHVGVRALKGSLHRKLTLGRKSLVILGNRTCVSGTMVQCSTNLATSHPLPRNTRTEKYIKSVSYLSLSQQTYSERS